MMGLVRWRLAQAWLWMGVLIGMLGGNCAMAVEVTAGPSVTFEVQGGQVKAILTWKTDTECGTRVRFGLEPEKLDQRAGDGVAIEHEVTLEGLKPGVTYHYKVGTAKVRLKEGQFTVPLQEGTGAGPVAVKKEEGPSKSGAAPRAPPPAKMTWGYLPSLRDHFERHGKDFGARNEEDYARLAWEFLQRAIDGALPAKQDASDGTLRVYDPSTGAFAAYNRNGTTKTFFKPGSRDYWERQPGRPVRLRRS